MASRSSQLGRKKKEKFKNLLRKENLSGIMIYLERRRLPAVSYLARQYEIADDRCIHAGSDYFIDDTLMSTARKGDVIAAPVRTTDEAKEVPKYDVYRTPRLIFINSCANQAYHDHGIIHERHSKGIPMLQICDVKLQRDPEDHIKYSWKLDEVTKEECKFEIDQSDQNEQGKKTIKFGFATNDTDKLQSQVIDGYEVMYMVRTDAVRLRLELKIVLTPPCDVRDLSDLHSEVKLDILHDSKPYTISFSGDEPRTKKQQLELSNATFELSITRNVPRILDPCMKLAVILKDSSGTLDVDVWHPIFSHNIPVDQEDYFEFENGYIEFKVFWGCCFDEGEGLCTGVCTCKPAEFVGFHSPGEVNNEE